MHARMTTAHRTDRDAAADPLTVVIANCWFDPDILNPEQLLERYHALTGWAEAIARTGAASVTVVQRFARDGFLRRGSVDYRFVADRNPGLLTPMFLARFTRAIGDLRPDVVHVGGFTFPAIVGCLRVRVAGHTAIVVQDHGGVRSPPGGWRWGGRRLLYRVGLGSADAFMFTAREQAALWQDAGIIRARHTVYEVLESSTDLGSWPSAKDPVAAVPGSPAILWVGRLDSNKDPITVLEGFAEASASLPQAALTLVYGDDVLLPAVKEWIEAHPGLRARIHLRGRVERKLLPEYYGSADLFVLGSHREVACFSLIEALSFGVSPVVTDIAPFRAITDRGSVGGLWPPGDARRCARALVEAANVDLAAERRRVLEHFERDLSWAAVGRRAVEIYAAVVSRRRSLIPVP